MRYFALFISIIIAIIWFIFHKVMPRPTRTSVSAPPDQEDYGISSQVAWNPPVRGSGADPNLNRPIVADPRTIEAVANDLTDLASIMKMSSEPYSVLRDIPGLTRYRLSDKQASELGGYYAKAIYNLRDRANDHIESSSLPGPVREATALRVLRMTDDALKSMPSLILGDARVNPPALSSSQRSLGPYALVNYFLPHLAPLGYGSAQPSAGVVSLINSRNLLLADEYLNR